MASSGQQEARVAALDNLRVRANQVMLGTRDHIEISHIDALRILDLFREISEDRDGLRAGRKQLWERMDTLERYIEAIGGDVDAAFALSAIATEAGTAETQGGSVHEGAGRKASPKPNNIGETNDR